jgi:hypothetical protein
MTLIRRFLLVVCLAFWQGGFMFYGGVVVPVGASVLGSEVDQGFITQSVTNYLNIAGAVCVVVWGVVIAVDTRHLSWLRRTSWLLWAAIAIALGLQIGLHVVMDRTLDIPARTILDEGKFLRLHSAYLTISTIQWLMCLGLLGLTLSAWKAPATLFHPDGRGPG